MREIQVFLDYACPFCYIGFSAMEKLIKEKDNINIIFIPYEIGPDTSIDGEDLRDTVDSKFVDESYIRIEKLASEYGLKYNNKYKKFNTNKLHKASLYAMEEGLYLEFSKLAFETIFTFGHNVSNEEVINNIASSIGLNINLMNEKINSSDYEIKIKDGRNLADRYLVDSVPTFIIDNKNKVTKLKSYDELIADILEII